MYIFLSPITPYQNAKAADLRADWEAGKQFYCHEFSCLVSKANEESYRNANKWSGFNLGNLAYIEFNNKEQRGYC